MASGWRGRLRSFTVTVGAARRSLLIAATVLGVHAQAQPLGVKPAPPPEMSPQIAATQAAPRVEVGLTALERPFPVASGQLIVGEISSGDVSAGPNWSGDLLMLHVLAGQVVTFQLKSTIPGVEVNVQSAKSLIPRPVVRGPANAAPIRFAAPKEGDYKIFVYATGPERFGKYLLSIGSEQGAPSFDSPIAATAKPSPSPAAPSPPAASPKPTPAPAPAAPTVAEAPRIATPVSAVDRTTFERLVERSGQSFVGANGSLDVYTEGDALVLHLGSMEKPRSGFRWVIRREPGSRNLTLLEHPNYADRSTHIAMLTPEGYLRLASTFNKGFMGWDVSADYRSAVDWHGVVYERRTGWTPSGYDQFYSLRSDGALAQAREDRANIQAARAEEAASKAESEARANAAMRQSLQNLNNLKVEQQREYEASVARTNAMLAEKTRAGQQAEAERLAASRQAAARGQTTSSAPTSSARPQGSPSSAASPSKPPAATIAQAGPAASSSGKQPVAAAKPAPSQKAATYSFCAAYGVKVAYLSPVFQTREAWSPLDAAKAFKARLEAGARDPQCAGALSEATASAQRASVVARDGKVMRIVDVPFTW